MIFSAKDVKREYYPLLDGMRGVAAIAVMCLHYTQHSKIGIFNNAGLAVDFFFMLSAFVLMASYGARLDNGMSAADYLKRRLIRLYPYFLTGVVLGGLSLLLLAQAGRANLSGPNILKIMGFNALFVPSYNLNLIQNFDAIKPSMGEIFPSNPPLWSLLFEMIASIVFM